MVYEFEWMAINEIDQYELVSFQCCEDVAKEIIELWDFCPDLYLELDRTNKLKNTGRHYIKNSKLKYFKW